jgi:hypothetical protein
MVRAGYERCSDTTDYSSLSNCSELTVQHIDLDWNIDFEANVVSGVATLAIVSTSDGLSKVRTEAFAKDLFAFVCQ